MDSDKPPKHGKCNLFLYFSVLTVNLATFSIGTTTSWTSPAIPRMNGQIDFGDNPLSHKITPYQESWIASLAPLGATISVFISGYFAERIGRKYTLLASTIIVIAGYACLYCGTEIEYFYVGRFLCGTYCGTVYAIVPMYVGEIAESSNRGALGCFFTFGMCVGGLIVFLLTPFVSLKVISAACLIQPFTFLLLFAIFIPESPYYYVSVGRTDLAEKSLLKFRFNCKEIVSKELPAIVKNVEESYANKISIRNICADKVTMRTFLISTGLMGFQQWSGINIVFFYMQSLFEEAGSKIPSEYPVIIGGILELVGVIFTLLVADRYGRRMPLMISTVGNTLVLLITGIYFCLRDNVHVNVDAISWLPVSTINLFVFTYTLGIGPVSFAMIGELFAPNVRSLAAAVNVFVNLFSIFCVTNIFPYLKEFVGIGLSFCLLAVICCASCVFVYVKVPETKGKKLEEIQDLFRKRDGNNM